MSSTTLRATRATLSAKWIGAGLLAGLVMGMWEMMIEAVIPNGAGFWSAPTYIAAAVFRNLQTVAHPVPFDPVAVMAGLMGHMLNSVILGLIFALLVAPRFKSWVSQAIAGMMYGAVVYVVMALAVVPLVDPVMANLNAVVFFLGHLMWGVALGVLTHGTTAKA